MMTQLYPVVGSVRADDKCYGLYELDLQSPGNKGFHRYQIIVVPIGEQLYEYRRDMGLAKKFKAMQFRVPGAIRDEDTGRVEFVHTVGELMDIAEQLREIPAPVHDMKDFKQEYVDHFEKIRKGRRGEQQFAITKHYAKG
jgi:hypothetical protein